MKKKKLASNVFVSSISGIIKAKRNKMREFIDDLNAKQFHNYLKLPLAYSRQKTRREMLRQEVKEEIARRIKIPDTKLKKKNQNPEIFTEF